MHASSNCQIARISRDDVFRLCMCSKTVLANLMRITADRFMFLVNRISFLSFRTIREKIIHYLETLAQPDGEFARIDMSLERLAEVFGVTKSALSRELSAFEESGRIERIGRRIRILRREEG